MQRNSPSNVNSPAKDFQFDDRIRNGKKKKVRLGGFRKEWYGNLPWIII